MPRGFVWSVYIDDNLELWRLRVNADYVDEDSRGWVPADPSAVDPLPRTWVPRKVVGVDSTGRTRSAIVASTEAALWTGAVTTFSLEASDGLFYPVSVTARLEEVRH